ncbi:N-acetyl-D-glucosamine kinase [Actinoplanes sp. SE50]|uniref:ROK family protein n=1 Tax=unclassified Actinoplanes TaxID=2626549 RepID=UPI00023EBD39|nr:MULTISPECIES: ROK family protein [unclassified Actinoplanes]AEV84522.1 N-acetyl-D-glucosamine kinase [Actinoplanes sp. SE50/110]ATO82914.1 N-acetyl-D-glucosamine kinase [Actinoplanes sp. SE50]SLM00322.1 N-acetyl-D-glucosamine kinase [Actinoplanes sp. SE50/110]
MYLSDSIGAGLVFGGALFRGDDSAAGRFGHMSIDHQGRPCPCGRLGCVERYASTAAVVAAARADPVMRAGLSLDGGTAAAYDAVARAAINGDPDAFALLDRAAARLGAAVTSMVNLLGLGRLVLTGPGVALAGSIYARRVRACLDRPEVSVEISAQPRDAAGIGAAALVIQASVAPGHTPGRVS